MKRYTQGSGMKKNSAKWEEECKSYKMDQSKKAIGLIRMEMGMAE